MKQHVPNIVTSCNLICGCIATVYAIFFQPEMAMLFIILGAAFDFCDGLTARLLNVSSPIGKELDSLADVVTFGVAPSAMAFNFLLLFDYPEELAAIADYIPFTAFVMAAFSALRLAKFNLDTRQTTSFIGLPTPANAMFWASLVVGFGYLFETIPYAPLIVLLLLFSSCYLLVCEMPMFALKFKHWTIRDKENILKYGFIIFCVLLFIASLLAGMVLCSFAIMILAYILLSFIVWRTNSRQQ